MDFAKEIEEITHKIAELKEQVYPAEWKVCSPYYAFNIIVKLVDGQIVKIYISSHLNMAVDDKYIYVGRLFPSGSCISVSNKLSPKMVTHTLTGPELFGYDMKEIKESSNNGTSKRDVYFRKQDGEWQLCEKDINNSRRGYYTNGSCVYEVSDGYSRLYDLHSNLVYNNNNPVDLGDGVTIENGVVRHNGKVIIEDIIKAPNCMELWPQVCEFLPKLEEFL